MNGIEKSLEWWNGLHNQNSEDSNHSKVVYIVKYYPKETDVFIYEYQIEHIWKSENKIRFRRNKIEKIKNKIKYVTTF